jgi:endoglucanase
MKRILCLFCFILSGFLHAQQLTESIKLNQLGFLPHEQKIAVITAPTKELSFAVTSTNLRDTFFKGILSDTIKSVHSSTVTQIADFSSFNMVGSFVIQVPGIGHSYVFRIDNEILNDVAKATLKGFYYQRISMPLEFQYAGKWHRSSGHHDTVVLVHPSAASAKRPAGTKLSIPGGWYDAGDYNKYIVNSGITTSTLLSAYEFNSDYYKKQVINIPESLNTIPDILDESLYNIRWMLTMQDSNDGGVYHKCTNAQFDGMVMPGVTKATRYVVQKSTAAALDFAAVMAQSARIFKSFHHELPGLSDSCMKAATAAWDWALQHPNVIYNQDKLNEKFVPKIETGSYGDGNINDEWFWAGASLFATTGQQQYLSVFSRLQDGLIVLPTWDNVAILGVYSLLQSNQHIPQQYADKLNWMESKVIELADSYTQYASGSAFKVAMGNNKKDFVWGSNSNAANQGILLLMSYRLTGKKEYVDVAIANVDYLLGRNATGYCFVTGYGSKSPMHPHHRQSEADGIIEPVPGLLVGGPNPYRQDKCNYRFVEAETAFTDDVCSYASNEIAINWNAPAVFLFNAFADLSRSKIK